MGGAKVQGPNSFLAVHYTSLFTLLIYLDIFSGAGKLRNFDSDWGP